MKQNDIFKTIRDNTKTNLSDLAIQDITQEEKEKNYQKLSAMIEKIVEGIDKQKNYKDKQKEFYFIFFKNMDTIAYELLKREA